MVENQADHQLSGGSKRPRPNTPPPRRPPAPESTGRQLRGVYAIHILINSRIEGFPRSVSGAVARLYSPLEDRVSLLERCWTRLGSATKTLWIVAHAMMDTNEDPSVKTN